MLYSHKTYTSKLNDRLQSIEGLDKLIVSLPSYYGYPIGEGELRYNKLFVDRRDGSNIDIAMVMTNGEIVSLRRFIAQISPTQVQYDSLRQPIDEEFIKANTNSDTYRTIVESGYLVSLLGVLRSIALTVYEYMDDITLGVTLPNADTPVQLLQVRTSANTVAPKVSWVSLMDNPRDFTEVQGDMHFGVRRIIQDMFIFKQHDIPLISTRLLSTWLKLIFVDDIQFEVLSQTTTYPTSADSVTADRILFFKDGLPRFAQQHLNRLYVSIESIKRHNPATIAMCGYTKQYGYYGDPDIPYTYYRSNHVTQPAGFLTPISIPSLYEICKPIRTEVCDSCDSCYHTTLRDFASQVMASDEYPNLARLFHNEETAMLSLYTAAQRMFSDDDPEYYCSECERGTYEDDDDYNDHDHRYYGLSENEITAMSKVAEQHSKVMSMTSDNYYVFTNSDDDAIRYPYMYEVNSYDFKPTLTFVDGDDTSKTKLYMGMELEMDNGGERHKKSIPINSALTGNKPHSWTMTDGSLSYGIEIATMPATLDAHMNVFNYDFACDVATVLGYRAHDTSTAGLHVHINRNFFGDDKHIQLYRASLMALIMERNWEDFVRFSRRRYNRLDQWAKKKNVADREYTDRDVDLIVEKTKREYNNGDKYLALNMNRMSTFELRIFRGSLKAETIKATLQFVSNLAHYCKYNGLKSAQQATILDIINYKKYPELTAYWEANKEREVS
jgi:hypothetical protein